MIIRFPSLLTIPLTVCFSILPLASNGVASLGTSEIGRPNAAVLTVEAIRPQSQFWKEIVPASGWLEAWQESIVSAEINGQKLIAVNADVGSTVHKGDILAELSSDTIKNEILQREAVVLTAQANVEQASSSADRARNLQGSGAVSQEHLTDAVITEKKALAELASAEAALASSKLHLSQTQILAIDDGVISSRTGALGNVVASGTELFRLIRQRRIEWRAEVPLKSMLNVSKGTKAVLPTSNGDMTGQVRLISPSTSIKNGRLTVFVDLTPPENAPPPTTGVLISGYFTTGEREAITLPSSAITIRDGFSYIYTLNRGDVTTVKRVRVSTGRRQDGLVEVLDGVSSDDEIVLSGGAFLSNGSIVRVAKNDAKLELAQ